MADKEAASQEFFSEQTTMDTVLDLSPRPKERPRPGGQGSGPEPARSGSPLGSGPPAHWVDLAREGYFAEQPKSKLQLLTDSITDSISSMQKSFEKKPIPWMYWGKAPVIRKEWFYLKGEQSLPLGANRWEPFEPDVQNMLTTASDLGFGRSHGLVAELGNDEEQQVWLACRLGTATEIVGFDPRIWEPRGDERPDSELLKSGKATAKVGHVMVAASERALMEEYYSSRWWTREEKPHLQVVLMVEETIVSAVEEQSQELSSPEYVLRVLTPGGLPVIAFRKHELEKHVMREVRLRFEEYWREKGNACFVSDDGEEVSPDETLKSMVKRKGKNLPCDIKVMYLTDAQAKLKAEGMATIMGGHFADLAREGYFNSRVMTPVAKACCVVS